ncbi:hypothetical protein Slin14017_G026350 [Septoria linicola]|nr:hypothetical protein Slin14017_G026350 [Septoria linicola]
MVFYPEHSPAGIKEYEHRTMKGVVWKSFDKDIYKGRIRVTIETALLAADDRAAFEGTKAHLFLAGLGLGVADCVERLDLRHINVLELGWDECPATVKSRLLAVGEKKDIKVIVSSKRDPCAQSASNDLHVRVWAWDSNSLPGNEYWSGKSNPKCLTSSDDPAAACCSTIAELHDPYVNPFEHRVKVLQERYCKATTAGSGSTTAKAKISRKDKPVLGKSAIKPEKSPATAASSSKLSKTSQKPS